MKNRKLREEYKLKPCVVCGRIPSDFSHIKTYATTLEDRESNAAPLCRQHHIEQHSLGILTFINKYPRYKKYITRKGWLVFNGKLLHNKNY